MSGWKKHDGYANQGNYRKGRPYIVQGGKWVECDAVAPIVETAPTPENCLTFSSAEPFTIATNNATKNWDGTLYYSTDTTTWSEWDGTEAIASAEHGGEQRIYMRGSENSVITGANTQTAGWVLTGSTISCSGNIETLLDYETVSNGKHPTMSSYCYGCMFYGCTSLVTAPELPATTLCEECYWKMFYGCTSLVTAPELPATVTTGACYHYMFRGCTSLVTIPKLPATVLASSCYAGMFRDCISIKLSATQTGEYQTEYRIPTSGTGTIEDYSLSSMFTGSGGTFAGTPEINTTYYTSNTVV